MARALKEFHLANFLMKNSEVYRTWKEQGTREVFEVGKTMKQWQNWTKTVTEMMTQLNLLEYTDIFITFGLDF